ncbi:hypothetical protein MTYP_00370 [Methylophilaceae bacterium]|nr:hypothetical protein MTYP_00370 [Methylophilaceae bacterium]
MIRTILWILSSAYFFAVGVAFLLLATESHAVEASSADAQLLIAEISDETADRHFSKKALSALPASNLFRNA